MPYILRARNVVFRSIIQYPEISIPTEKATFIQGPSGCGKSTLLKLFNRTVSPDSGHLFYKEKNIETIDTILLRQEVLLVGQSVFLFKGSIEDNFREYYDYRDLQPISKEQIKQYLTLCCAEFPLDTPCDTMSGGERQRIYIAICVSLMPKVLMMDEPTSALDGKTAKLLLSNIKRFCAERGITLLVVSHDKELTREYADEIITIKKEVE